MLPSPERQSRLPLAQLRGTSTQVPGSDAPAGNGTLSPFTVSCSAPGDCSATGYYYLTVSGQQPFVATQDNGTWGNVIPVPGVEALSHDEDAAVNSLSCASAGYCSAGGFYSVGPHNEAFVVSKT